VPAAIFAKLNTAHRHIKMLRVQFAHGFASRRQRLVYVSRTANWCQSWMRARPVWFIFVRPTCRWVLILGWHPFVVLPTFRRSLSRVQRLLWY